MFLSKRRGNYYLFFDDAGKRRTRSTGARTKPEALHFLRNFNAEKDAQRRALQSVTLEAFKDSYLQYCKSIHTAKTVESSDMALRVLICYIGADRIMHTITAAECGRFIAKKAGDTSVWTALRLYRTLAAAFERARTWGTVIVNPWRAVKKPKAPEMIPAYFTRDQFKALLSAIDDRDLRELATFATLTGCRQGELLAMRWDWVDFTRRMLTVKNSADFVTKSKRVRVVPLADEALAVLFARRERMNAGTGLVFTRKGERLNPRRVSESLKRAVRKAGLPDALHFHSLRHTSASWLVQGGVSLYQVAKLLGHSSTAVTEQYAHLVPSDMHGVLAPLNFKN